MWISFQCLPIMTTNYSNGTINLIEFKYNTLRMLLSRGQKYYFDYRNSIESGMFVGFLTVISIASILDVLICTNKSSTTVTAYKRYAESVLYHDYFYRDLPDDQNSL